ncbi:hypothetical protein F4779DRAFT_598019 [Xylariaceae sp. FL0662B]|nr:hypothetical protein F4779DRAFT_598019 [Xylariaceae sp. FL0662B]
MGTPFRIVNLKFSLVCPSGGFFCGRNRSVEAISVSDRRLEAFTSIVMVLSFVLPLRYSDDTHEPKTRKVGLVHQQDVDITNIGQRTKSFLRLIEFSYNPEDNCFSKVMVGRVSGPLPEDAPVIRITLSPTAPRGLSSLILTNLLRRRLLSR